MLAALLTPNSAQSLGVSELRAPVTSVRSLRGWDRVTRMGRPCHSHCLFFGHFCSLHLGILQRSSGPPEISRGPQLLHVNKKGRVNMGVKTESPEGPVASFTCLPPPQTKLTRQLGAFLTQLSDPKRTLHCRGPGF